MNRTLLPTTRRAALFATTALGLIAATGSIALANPTGGQVTSGSATITTSPDTVTVQQGTDRAVIDWQDFSIAEGETTRFVQPGTSSVTLNRVTGDNPSTILGTLTANGNVFLINRSGILVGAGATVDVGGLVATTSDIDDTAFMAGGGHFDRPTDVAGASVINNGTITIADHGLAALVGPTVANNGAIAARLGTVALGSRETFTVDLAGDGLIAFDTGQPVGRNGDGPEVSNSGTIRADGGTVVLTAGQAAAVVDKAIDMSGVISAQSVGIENGTIVLSGGEGTTSVSGLIDASGSQGGTVTVTGGAVRLEAGATIDASGSQGGGTVRLGGDLKGQGSTPRARTTNVAAGSTIDVSARDQGNGGLLVVWSDQRTDFAGNAFARGGAGGGDGGLIETSSKGVLGLGSGLIDASAPLGQGGEWLIDPADVSIVNAGVALPGNPFNPGAATTLINVDSIIAVLQTGTDVTINTGSAGDGIGGSGSITYNATPAAFAVGGDGTATLTLNAVGAINWSGTLSGTGGFTLRANAGERITFSLGGLSAQTIDLNGCLTSADCGVPPVSAVVPPIGIVFDPFVAGVGGPPPTVTLTGETVILRGGLGGIFSNAGTTVNVGQSLVLQGIGEQAYTFAAGTFAPAAGATATFVPTFEDSDLVYTEREATDTLNDTIDNRDLAELAGFETITMRTGAADATFNVAGPVGTSSIIFDGAFAGASLSLGNNLVLDANDGGSITLNDTLTVFVDRDVTMDADDTIRMALGLTLDGSLNATAPDILLGGDVTSNGGSISLTGAVGAENSLDISAVTDLTITGTLDGTAGTPSPVPPGIGLFSETTSVTVTGLTGARFILDSLTANATTGISVNSVATSGDQTYSAPAVTLTGTTYQAGGNLLIEGNALIANAVGITTDGNIDVTGTITRAAGAPVASLAANAGVGGSTSTIFVTGDIGTLAAALDSVALAAGDNFSIANVFTTGNQTYGAARGNFGGATYLASAGSIDTRNVTIGLLANSTTFDAGTDARFGAIEVDKAENTLDVFARAGAILFDAAIGASNAPAALNAVAATTLTAANLRASGPVSLTAPILNFTGDTYGAGTTFSVTGNINLGADTAIEAAGNLLLGGTVDLDPMAAADSGLTLTSTAGSVTVTGAIGGTGAPAFVTATADSLITLGNVATLGAQNYTAPTVVLNGARYQAGGAFRLDGAASIATDTTVTAAGDIGFTGTIGRLAGAPTASLTALSGGGGPVGDFSAGGLISGLDSVNLTAGNSLTLNGVVTSGDQDYGAATAIFGGGTYRSDLGTITGVNVGQTNLNVSTVFEAEQNIRFGAIDPASGGQTLSFIAHSGEIRLNGPVGGFTAPDTLALQAATAITAAFLRSNGDLDLTAPIINLNATSYRAGGAFTATGNVNFGGPSVVTADGTLTVTGSVDLLGSAAPDSAIGFISTGGDVRLGGPIGDLIPLGALTVEAAGTVRVASAIAAGDLLLTGASVILTGANYQAGGRFAVTGPALLTDVTAINAGDDLTFSGTIDAAAGSMASLTAVGGANGRLSVGGLIGAGAALDALDLSAGDLVTLAGATTNGAMRLASGTRLSLAGTYTNDTDTITIDGPVTLTGDVTLSAAAGLTVTGTVEEDPDTNAAFDAGTRTGDFTASGEIRATSVTLGAADRLTVGSVFSGTALNIAGSAISLSGGTLSAVTDVLVAGTTVTLLGDTTIAGGVNATLVGTTASGAGAPNLDLLAEAGFVLLGGPVTGLGDVRVNAATLATLGGITTNGNLGVTAGLVLLNAPTYQAGGDLRIQGITSLTQDTDLSAGGDVTLAGTVDTLASLPLAALAVDAVGDIAFLGPMGLNGGLARLEAVAGGIIDVLASAETTGDLIYRTPGRIFFADGAYRSTTAAVTLDGPVTVTGLVTIEAQTDLTVTGSIDGDVGVGGVIGDATLIAHRNLIIPGAIGLGRPLASLDLRAGTMIDPLSVVTFGPQTYTAPLIILAGDEYRTNGGAFTTHGELRLTAPSVIIDTTGGAAASGGDGDILFDGFTTGHDVILDAGIGNIEGLNVAFGSLHVLGGEGSALMGGTIGGRTGPGAARLIGRPAVERAYVFNDCIMATFCGIQELEGETRIIVPDILPLAPPLVEAPDLIVATLDDQLDDLSRFVFSNTGKDALWRLDLSFPASNEENGR